MDDKPATQLPQEVLEAILANLHPRKDIQSLRQCTLAARCLLPTAQRIIFHRVILAEPRWVQQGQMDQFLGLLDSSPHLAEYPKEISLFFQPSEWGDSDLSQKPLAFIVPRLLSLEEIEIRMILSDRGTMPAITSRQISTLLGGTDLPKITSFSLSGARVADMKEAFGICEWLATCGSLRNLELKIATNAPPSELITSPAPTATPSIHLRRFTISQGPGVISSFLNWATSSSSPLQFTELHELTVGSLDEQSLIYLFRVLDLAANSLSCLRFTGEIPSLSSFQLESLCHLRSIFSMLYLLRFEQSQDTVNEWCTALKRSKGLKLDSFIIEMSSPIQHPSNNYEPLDSFPEFPWTEFEDALVNVTKCARVEIRVSMSFKRLGSDTLRECFPLLHGNNVGELVVRQRVLDSGEPVGWEYSSYYQQWKTTILDELFD
ncbi:hypothetical protein VNI00_004232 [Paramarasmius palmivorus]|uniref:F-box domain-containing protein n=1 Tax=Paramarasmius palmivorus TaxID=297713 RepID=A0AAW0DNE9_9AGAR